MYLADYHVHTTFSDGADTPAGMAAAACAAGLKALGFSDHSYTPCDESYCMKAEDYIRYKDTVRALKERYDGRLRILCGIEQDYYGIPYEGFDYSIGSVHYIKCGSSFIPVDESPEILKEAADRFFGGDLIALAEKYFETVSGVAEKTGCRIIGHFDLIGKFNEGDALFDSSDPRYIRAWKEAAGSCLKTGLPFEINTGAVSRGFRTEGYPSREIISYIRERGGSFLLSGDAHSVSGLCYGFNRYSDLVSDENMHNFCI